MIKALEGLDARAALGVLARAALTLDYANRPLFKVVGEEVVQNKVLKEIRARLGHQSRGLSGRGARTDR